MSLMHRLLIKLMRSRKQVILTTAILSVLSAAIGLPFILIVAGIISLTTLSQGSSEGIRLLFYSLGIIVLSKFVMEQANIYSIGFVLFMLTPVWLLAMLLRFNYSAWNQLLFALSIALVSIALLYILIDDLANWKIELFGKLVGMEPSQFPPEIKNPEIVLTPYSPIFIGDLITVVMLMIWLGGNYLGRWWQAILYKPGGFAKEFRGLHIGREMAIPALLVILMSLNYTGTWRLVANEMLIPVMAVYWLGGVALLHYFFAQWQIHRIFVVLFYVSNIIPPIMVLTIIFGFLDSLFNFRDMYKRFEHLD